MDAPEPLDRIRKDLKEFASYSAHTSPDYMKKKFGLNLEEIIKLDANENPFGCSPRVFEAMNSCTSYSVYPDAAQTELRRELSLYTSMPPECIVCGAGSDQLIDLIIRLTVKPGDEIINLPPTFGMYSFYGKLSGAQVINVYRGMDFVICFDEIVSQITPRTKLIFLANPNNPSGNITPKSDIQALLETGVTVVVDEAYYEFSRETVAPWIERYDNLIVLRTFSKWAGLAGLRVGYGIFPQYMAEYMMRIKDPYSINIAAQNAAIASLQDKEFLLERIDRIIFERERLFGLLSNIKKLLPVPSKANFILSLLIEGRASLLTDTLKQRGILVRYFDAPEMKKYFRISIGKPEQNDVLVESIKEILLGDTQW
ncbi:MAG: histidinol-phosphate transaminase [Dehalococcoidales bacterium]|nr:histidinol-phosphate transaminase [Dehalococcoidales bacterium]